MPEVHSLLLRAPDMLRFAQATARSAAGLAPPPLPQLRVEVPHRSVYAKPSYVYDDFPARLFLSFRLCRLHSGLAPVAG